MKLSFFELRLYCHWEHGKSETRPPRRQHTHKHTDTHTYTHTYTHTHKHILQHIHIHSARKASSWAAVAYHSWPGMGLLRMVRERDREPEREIREIKRTQRKDRRWQEMDVVRQRETWKLSVKRSRNSFGDSTKLRCVWKTKISVISGKNYGDLRWKEPQSEVLRMLQFLTGNGNQKWTRISSRADLQRFQDLRN